MTKDKFGGGTRTAQAVRSPIILEDTSTHFYADSILKTKMIMKSRFLIMIYYKF